MQAVMVDLTDQERNELAEAIAKIMDSILPEYEPFNVPYERDKQIKMPDPLNGASEELECFICQTLPLPNMWSICDGDKCKLLLCIHCE